MIRLIVALMLGFTLAVSAAPALAQTVAQTVETPAATDGRVTLKELLYSARKGDVLAQRLLGDRYDRGNGLPRDYQKAARWYLRAANKGDRVAQRNLGYIHETGLVGEQNYVEAEKWYRKAAEQGDAEAQRSLVYIYESGVAGEVNLAKAGKWADRAAGRAFIEPTEEIAQVEKQLLARIRAATSQVTGDPDENGKGSLPVAALDPEPTDDARPLDIGLSMNRYHPAAEDGDLHAQYRLGLVYLKGQGVRQDGRQAHKWLLSAAEGGYARAQAALGTMYAKGIGTRRNLVQAYFWLQQAATRLPDGETKQFALNFGKQAEKDMTPEQHAEANQLTRDFSPEIAPATLR